MDEREKAISTFRRFGLARRHSGDRQAKQAEEKEREWDMHERMLLLR
jgi:hypothetical protein